MNVDEFAEKCNSPGTKFYLSDITLTAEGKKYRGRGSMTVSEKKFIVDMEVLSQQQTPEPVRVLWKPADAWKLRAKIDGELVFSSNQVSPMGKTSSWGALVKSLSIQKLSFEMIDFPAVGLDRLTRFQRDKIFKKPPSKKKKFPEVEISARLRNCEIVFRNAGTVRKTCNAFLGKTGGSSYDTFIDRSID